MSIVNPLLSGKPQTHIDPIPMVYSIPILNNIYIVDPIPPPPPTHTHLVPFGIAFAVGL